MKNFWLCPIILCYASYSKSSCDIEMQELSSKKPRTSFVPNVKSILKKSNYHSANSNRKQPIQFNDNDDEIRQNTQSNENISLNGKLIGKAYKRQWKKDLHKSFRALQNYKALSSFLFFIPFFIQSRIDQISKEYISCHHHRIEYKNKF